MRGYPNPARRNRRRHRRRPGRRLIRSTSGEPTRGPFMEPDRSDTNLLFGILAVKMNFIAKEDLFEAMGIWFLDRRKALGDILVERQALSGRDRDLLDAMVRESQSRQGQPLKSGSQDRPDAPT